MSAIEMNHVHPFEAVSGRSQRILAVLRLWRRRARERNELARMNERDIKDLGLSEADWRFEIAKAPWQA